MAEFWSEPGSEPKRGYRWLMRFGINGINAIDEFLVKTVSRPSWSLTESSHVFLNHTFHYPGRVTYDDISVTIVDSIQPNAAVNMYNLLVAAGYTTPDTANFDFTTVSKKGWGQSAGLGDVQIVQLDHDAVALETWHLYNAWIKSCNLGDLSYESDDLLNVQLTLKYDYFKIGGSTRLDNANIAQVLRAG